MNKLLVVQANEEYIFITNSEGTIKIKIKDALDSNLEGLLKVLREKYV